MAACKELVERSGGGAAVRVALCREVKRAHEPCRERDDARAALGMAARKELVVPRGGGLRPEALLGCDRFDGSQEVGGDEHTDRSIRRRLGEAHRMAPIGEDGSRGLGSCERVESGSVRPLMR